MRLIPSLLAMLTAIFAVTMAGCGPPSAKMSSATVNESLRARVDVRSQRVDFCDLVSNPHLYDQKIVRTEAIAAVMTSEMGFLYNPNCNSQNSWIDYEYDNDRASAVTALFLRNGFGKDTARRAGLILEGRFTGPRETGFGHLNTLRFHFSITAVEKAEMVSMDVPWPANMDN